MRLLFVTLSFLLFVGCTKIVEKVNIIEVNATTKISDMVLKIPIALQDKGYKNLKTQVIKSRDEYNKFIKDVKKEKGWEHKKNFLEMLKGANIDFDNENLIIYPFSEDKSVIVVVVDAPISKDNHIIVKIGKDKTKKLSNIIEYYALSYKVKKSAKDIIFDDGENKVTVENR
jgi:hypothetical protein